VEFIVNSDREFFFLEMNTRLQVEHPVTEYITGVDLVEQMIKIAANNPLELKQSDIGIKGWSVESRVYAEDPLNDFLPSIGTLQRYTEPCQKDGDVRVDTGVEEGAEISIYYDPLISKLITYGPDRASAIAKMRDALDSYVIRGVTSNTNFLRSLMDHPRFLSGEIDTKFIEDEYPDGFQGHVSSVADIEALASAAVAVHLNVLQSQTTVSGKRGDFDSAAYLKAQAQNLVINVEDKVVNVCVQGDLGDADNQTLHLEVEGEAPRTANVTSTYKRGDDVFKTVIDGEKHIMQVVEMKDASRVYTLMFKGSKIPVRVMRPDEAVMQDHMPIPEVIDTSRIIMSPMPGLVFSVNVKEGDKVHAGQEVCVIEAMKMQNTIRAEKESIVLKVNVEAGQTVQAEDILLELE